MSVRLVRLTWLLLCLSPLVSQAQSREPVSDVNLGGQAVWPFNSSSSTLDVKSSISGGGIVGYRRNIRGHHSAEVNYAYSRSTFYYTINETTVGGGTIFLSQQSAWHQFTGDYVYNFSPWGRLPRLQPFVLGGGGMVLFRPISNSTNTVVAATTQAKGTLLFGGGLDYRLAGPFSLRVQYRGLYLFHAPDFYGAAVTGAGHMIVAAPAAELVFHF